LSTIYYCIIDTVNNTFVDKGDCYDGPAPESPPPIVENRLKVTGIRQILEKEAMLRSVHRMLSPEFPKEADGRLYHIMSFTLTALSPSVSLSVNSIKYQRPPSIFVR
jgi:hypothetical protein